MDNHDFCKILPKVELHAHLTGSIDRQSLHSLWKSKQETGQLEKDVMQDPMMAIPPAAKGISIKTFFPIFDKYIYNLITTAQDVRATTNAVLDSFAADGVVYLELRTTPRANASAELSKEAYVALVLETIASHNACQSRLYTRLILTIDRRMSAAEADEVVDLAIRFRAKGIVGVDLAGNPLVGNVTTFRQALARAKLEGLNLTLHFGETASSGKDEELLALLEMQPQRLGHVIHLSRAIREEVIKRRLGLELCLSCNVLAEMTSGGFRGHHVGTWLGGKCPVALSTDDVGIFESELSHEYEMLMEHFDVGKRLAVDLSRQAASVIFGGDEEKLRVFRLLDEFEAEHIEGVRV